jgi:hypothetical protein
MVSACSTAGIELHAPSSMDFRSGALGWISGLPSQKARPEPASISAMPMAVSLTRARLHSAPCSSPKTMPTAAAASTPSHGLPVVRATA